MWNCDGLVGIIGVVVDVIIFVEGVGDMVFIFEIFVVKVEFVIYRNIGVMSNLNLI